MPRISTAGGYKVVQLTRPVVEIPTLQDLALKVLATQLNNPRKLEKAINNVSKEKRKNSLIAAIKSKSIQRNSFLLYSAATDCSMVAALDFSGSSITDYGLYMLSGITSILSLNLHACRNVTNQGIAYLSHLKHLQRLDISKCKISDDGLAPISKIEKLRYLNVDDITTVGKGLCNVVNSLKHLESLSLSRTRFASHFLSEIIAPKLQVLTLRDTLTVNDSAIQSFTTFTNLTELDISGTRISTNGFGILQGLIMGRGDIVSVKCKFPMIVLIQKRSKPVSLCPSLKLLQKVPTLIPATDLTNYLIDANARQNKAAQNVAVKRKSLPNTNSYRSYLEQQMGLQKFTIDTAIRPPSRRCSNSSDSIDSDEILLELSKDDSSEEILMELSGDSSSEEDLRKATKKLSRFSLSDGEDEVTIKIATAPKTKANTKTRSKSTAPVKGPISKARKALPRASTK